MQNIAGSGRTVIFVSHNMGAVQRLCTRGVVIDAGRIIFTGDTLDAISAFLSSISSLSEAVPMTGSLNRVVKVQSLDINGRSSIETIRIRPRAEVVIDLAVSITAAVPKAKVIISIRKNNDKIIDLHDVAVPADLPSGIARIRGTLPPYFLSPGDYSVSILCFSSNGECAWADGIGTFSILAEAAGSYDIGNMGLVHLSDRVVRVSVGEKTDEVPNMRKRACPRRGRNYLRACRKSAIGPTDRLAKAIEAEPTALRADRLPQKNRDFMLNLLPSVLPKSLRSDVQGHEICPVRRRELAPHVTANTASPRRTEESRLVLARARFLRSSGARELFVGITSWNSALFLPHCIQAVRANTTDVRTEIVVLDNLSEDGSADIARAHGTNVIEERCTQPDALNRLFLLSRSRYTLLMHVDVILLDPRWFDLCRSKLGKNTRSGFAARHRLRSVHAAMGPGHAGKFLYVFRYSRCSQVETNQMGKAL